MDEMLKAGLDEMGQPLQTVEELNMLVGENPDNLLQEPQPMLNDEQRQVIFISCHLSTLTNHNF